ncbi:MAG TPA: class I tRNA ligase family protein, partial [Phycisphaerae bacterium]|nr:class I tRNA ligase family protein [Phycisphaerae bacterium]
TSERFELGRNFCNKIWNAARFAFMNLEGQASDAQPADSATAPSAVDRAALPIEDRWMLSRVSRAAVEVQDALAKFSFSRAATLARDFFWDSLCDWYLELVKSRIKENRQAAEARMVLAFALDQSLRLLHPFVPFITERLWKQLNQAAPRRGIPGLIELDTGKPLIVSAYPPVEGWPALNDPAVDAVFDDLQTATRAVREIRSTQNVPPKNPVNVIIKVPADRVESLRREAHVIKRMAHVGELTIDPQATRPKNAATLVFGDMQIFVLDVIDSAAERKRLESELANIDKQVTAINGKLSNEGFVSRAPANIVQAERDKLANLQARREVVLKTLAEL